jgi:hypothetical protein
LSKSKTKNRNLPARRGGRAPKRTTRPREFPWLPVAVAALFAVVALGMVAYVRASTPPSAAKSNAILCQSGEQLATHYHAHLTILYGGRNVEVPEFIGVQSSCLYWIHTHDSSGVIHIEAPPSQKSRKFTLGDFFDIWGVPLSTHVVGNNAVAKGQSLAMYVDGKPYAGDPRAIVLKRHTQVVLEITPPKVVPPPTYSFAPGL